MTRKTRNQKLMLHVLAAYGQRVTLEDLPNVPSDVLLNAMRSYALLDPNDMRTEAEKVFVDEAINWMVAHRRMHARPGTLPVFLTQREMRMIERTCSIDARISSETDGRHVRALRRAVSEDILPLPTEEFIVS
jgi:hypothetical protein